jgi:hypothetical protein
VSTVTNPREAAARQWTTVADVTDAADAGDLHARLHIAAAFATRRCTYCGGRFQVASEALAGEHESCRDDRLVRDLDDEKDGR